MKAAYKEQHHGTTALRTYRTHEYGCHFRRGRLLGGESIQQAVNFALSQDVTGLCTAGDLTLLPLFLQACERFTPMNATQQETLIASATEAKYTPLFT